LEYPKRLRRLLLTPEREVAVELALLRDNGEVATFNAYRVQHDNSRGPYKGGLRYHPDVDLDDVRRWAGAALRCIGVLGAACLAGVGCLAAMQLCAGWLARASWRMRVVAACWPVDGWRWLYQTRLLAGAPHIPTLWLLNPPLCSALLPQPGVSDDLENSRSVSWGC
jgi:hypothetical protein